VRRISLPLLALLALAVLAACRPASVSEAEARGDVKWLQQNGSPEAVSSLGRLADKDPAALAALTARASFDPNVYAAAWAATLREAPWGSSLLRTALADPARAETAASKMDRHDSHVDAFVPDLEQALVRLSASTQNTSIARALAGGSGATAHDAVQRRLADGATRGAMCRGIEAPDSSADAKKTLLAVPDTSRDAPACVDAVVRLAAESDTALTWMATSGEPGILGAAGKSDSLPCALVHTLWARALEARPPAAYPALVVPLGNAVKRCTEEMDGVLADALTRLPRTHPVVVNAIDPYDSYGQNLKATCAALVKVVAGGDAPIVRERAEDAREHGCVSK
jgi:hypothetical protein